LSETAIASIVLAAAITGLLASGVWVAFSLLWVGVIGLALFTPAPVGSLLVTTVWESSWNWALTALPMFVWMGEILFRSRLSENLFTGLAPWLRRIPGRLLHVNILGCGLVAAVSGSSPVACATVGRMTIPELKKLGYDHKVSIGTLAGSGTLGILIPPSIQLIVFGFVAEVSIAKLFIAGIMPGALLIVLFMSYVAYWAHRNPTRMPPAGPSMSLVQKIMHARQLLPVFLLIIAVLGSIYGGFMTPTEAAVAGVIGALALAAFTGLLTFELVIESLLGAVRTSCMIAFIVISANLVAVTMGFTGIPVKLATWVASMELPTYALLFALALLYLFLGCLMDGISVVVLTAAVVLPMVKGAGIDLVWFGIWLTIMVEISMITPPVGLNLFVLQGLTKDDIWTISRAALPMLALMVIGSIIITLFPQIVLALPDLMYSSR
jgi:C4-dicarboxylate transporter DctM subunit